MSIPTTTPATPSGAAHRTWPHLSRRRVGVLLTAGLALAYAGPSYLVAERLSRPPRLALTAEPGQFGLAVESVDFPSREDQLTLRGWLLTARPAAAAGPARLIIVIHGIRGVRDDPTIGLVPIAGGLVGGGFDVLLFDLRGHGQSDGERTSLGWYERRDVQGALDWAAARGYRQIGLQGYSMGAAAAVMTAAIDRRAAALVIDSSFAEARPLLSTQITLQSGLPPIYTPGILLGLELLSGFDLDSVRPVEAMAQLRDRPVLILHGQDDQAVSAAHAEALWQARYGLTGDPRRAMLRLFPGAGHVQSYRSAPATYLDIVRAFWAAALPAARPSAQRLAA